MSAMFGVLFFLNLPFENEALGIRLNAGMSCNCVFLPHTFEET